MKVTLEGNYIVIDGHKINKDDIVAFGFLDEFEAHPDCFGPALAVATKHCLYIAYICECYSVIYVDVDVSEVTDDIVTNIKEYWEYTHDIDEAVNMFNEYIKQYSRYCDLSKKEIDIVDFPT